MASASPRVSRGKLFQLQERKQGEHQCLAELAKGALVEHADLANEALGIEEADL